MSNRWPPALLLHNMWQGPLSQKLAAKTQSLCTLSALLLQADALLLLLVYSWLLFILLLRRLAA